MFEVGHVFEELVIRWLRLAGFELHDRKAGGGQFGFSVAGGRLQGHVDGVGEIIDREPSENWEIVRISLPDDLGRYVVEKGSITVDGVSLTVVDAERDSFSVSLIPTTLELTTLGYKTAGDPVNLEVDVVAKYVERMLQWRG